MIKPSKTTVITICASFHAEVWKLTSKLLPIHVKADEYLVYVPEEDLGLFRDITDPAITILAQETLGAGYREKLKSQLDKASNPSRYGWYLQQFFKLEALINSDADRLVIWDADCVPVSDIFLFDSRGMPIYMTAGEFHAPYFQMIERLLGIPRVQAHSFVIPGFPILKSWVSDVIGVIEKRNNGQKWFDAILSHTYFEQMSGFSETETLGTWIANSYPDQWSLQQISWERLGQSRFGKATEFDSQKLTELGKREGLQVITFENWDLKRKSSLLKSLKSLFARLLPDRSVTPNP
jgi:hypothetical protein